MDENRAITTDGKGFIQKQKKSDLIQNNQQNVTTTVGADTGPNNSYFYQQANQSPMKSSVVSNFYVSLTLLIVYSIATEQWPE